MAHDASLLSYRSISRIRKAHVWEYLTTQKPVILYLLLVGCSFLAHSNQVSVSVVSAVLILLFLIFCTDIGAMLWLVMVLLTPDRYIYKFTTPDTLLISNTLFLNSVDGVTIIVIITLLALGFFLCYLMISSCRVHKLFLLFLLPLAIPLHGFLYTTDMRIAISDSRYLLAPCAMFLALKASGMSVQSFFEVFKATLIVKALTILAFSYLFTEPGLTYWGCTVYLLPLLLVLNYNKSLRIKLFLTVVVLICIFTFPARGRIICFVYALVIMFFVAGSQYRLIFLVTVGCSFALIFPWIIVKYQSALEFRFILWKISTFNIFSPDSTSSNMRLLEFLNILSEQIELIYPMFIGKGYGGYFVDNFIPLDSFGILGTAAFPDEHIVNRTFFDPHTNINFLLLKAGLLPSLFFFGGLIYFAFIRKYRLIDLRERYLMFYLPIIGIIMVTIKMSLVFGAFMFVLDQLLFRKNELGRSI